MNRNFQDFLKESLSDIKAKQLFRSFTPASSRAGAYMVYKDRKVLQMSSNNYLGLAGDPRLEEAAIKAIEKFGIGSTGSRLISGTHKLHIELEEKIANMKGTEKALVFSTGYAANLGTISALVTENDAVYSDELNHASIIDGIKFSKCAKFIYKHCDTQDLERLLEENYKKYCFNFIITDSIFSMDGDRAPLNEIVRLKEKYETVLFIDEAHAFGVYGNKGQGLAHELGINDKIDIQMGTLSKAVGSSGGYIAGSKELIDYLINKSRSFIYSTAPEIPAIAASIKSLEIIENDQNLRNKLYDNIKFIKNSLNNLDQAKNITIIPSESAIFCAIVGDQSKTLEVSKKLLEEHNIFATAIRPPTVKTSTIRFCTTALHSEYDLSNCLAAFNLTIQK